MVYGNLFVWTVFSVNKLLGPPIIHKLLERLFLIFFNHYVSKFIQAEVSQLWQASSVIAQVKFYVSCVIN